MWWTALPIAALLCAPAAAQVSGPPIPVTSNQQESVDFSADEVSYDTDAEIVAASGRVRMANDGNYLAADRVTWNRATGRVQASGNVVVTNPQGDKLVGETVDLTDSLRDGTIQNLLVVLESGGRIAATSGTRTGNVTTLQNAIYSPCPVTKPSGCPRTPSWAITAAEVIHDPARGQTRFRGGRLRLFGMNLPLLPVFSVATGGGSGGASGVLAPDFSISSRKGLEIAIPYYWRIAPNRDLTVTPHAYTNVLPALELKYRQLNKLGAFQIGGFGTYGHIESADLQSEEYEGHGFRGYLEGNGRAQLSPEWSITGAFRAATDKTVTRRYDITRDDRLRSFVNAERINTNSYISIAGWAFQGLRVDDRQKQMPIALPAIDARFRLQDVAGGTVELQGNSLSILRVEGQDTQRAFTSARWDLRRYTPMGQELTLTAYARGDLYHTDTDGSVEPSFYRGESGWHARGIGALAADMRWPLVGAAFGGVQRLTPRVQLVLTPPTLNLDIPNEDARAVDLEDSNLFALNRFPGYDRWEDGSRVTYGLEWALDRSRLSFDAVVGQSYRLRRDPSLFPEGTGLTDRWSDIVGRTRIRYGRFIDLSHRYRLDKDSFAIRRNEVDLTAGTNQTYVQIGYLRLNRGIDDTIEDLRDKEELRLAGRVRFARYWSVFGATVVDLSSKKEDPLSLADGFEAVRNRLGILYEDDCIQLGVSWRRDYERIGSFRKGSTFSLSFGLKGLGR
ncbi:LPS-assembly protein LptD [Sphingomonas piscis]|uniref:LPS-assembly protein LptD n=1 Tax=Sphingomonas piscis TaxID=2714943 RepID=A0A6G7YST8_9SPHN|nr:LPS assembly protein LptD [Sphingomonas piscis]QIK79799.1 LPS-assembly protein LptD [Sphingomonas piscis]